MMNDVQFTLLAARTLIADPRDWCKGSLYEPMSAPDLKTADRWCVRGAICLVGRDAPIHWTVADDTFQAAIGGASLPDWNDNHTHAEVMAAFDRAIELAA